MVNLIALSGVGIPGPIALHDSGASQERIVGLMVVAATRGPAHASRSVTPAPQAAPIVVKDLDIVVPSVEPSDKVASPAVPLKTQRAAGTVVADRLVAPRRVESEVVKAVGFQTLGVTWPGNVEFGNLGGQVRTRTNGKWSSWVDLAPSDSAPDPGTADAARAVRVGTDPVSIGNVDAVQLAFTASGQGGPPGLSLALIGSTDKPVADRAVGAATIQTVAYSSALVQPALAPTVITRAQWGAPAQSCTPDVAPALVGATVHHTAGLNDYATIAQAEQQIRNDAAYHINSLHWCDIGYNFIVDRWGNIYEGRAKSLSQAVVGAHAGGFNAGTVGVAMLGTYSAAPSAATQRSVAQIIGWRLGVYGADPQGSMTYHTDDGGAGVRYKNQNVALPRVFGHRDVWFTECPGNGGYSSIPNIRALASTFSYPQRLTQAQSVVKALYLDLLGRSVDSSGLQMWGSLLAGGGSQAGLVASLTKSSEYVQLRVLQAYQQVLGRTPDVAGTAAWSKEILAGRIPVDDLQRRLYASSEFYARSGATPDGFVNKLYVSVLGRSATAGDVAVWGPKSTTYGRAYVANAIWFSMEAAMYRAGAYFRLFLNRDPDPLGQATWARVVLLSGEGAVRTGIAGSAEYRLLSLQLYP